TCQLFLAALRDAARTYEVFDYLEELQRYTANRGLMADATVEKYKVWPSEFDQAAFKAIIDSQGIDAVAEKYPAIKGRKQDGRPLVVQAYVYFSKVLEDFLTREVVSERLHSQPSSAERVRALYEVFQCDLQTVSIELENQDDPQVIFETLNARGEPLLPSDLLRNHLFWRASRAQEDIRSLYERYWRPFDTDFWKKVEKQGRLTRPRVDLFFFNYLQVKSGSEVNVARLYHEYKAWSKESGNFAGVSAELSDIHRYSLHLEKLLQPSKDTAIGRFAEMLQVFDVKTVFPLVLKVLAAGLPEPELEGILVDLESYLIRRQICGLPSQAYNRVFVNWVSKLNGNGDKISRQGLRGLLLGETAESTLWPSDAMTLHAWLSEPLYPRLKTNGRMEYILRRLEMHSRTAKHEPITIDSRLTVEHVLPQGWIEHWRLPNGAKGIAPADRLLTPSPESDQRDRVLHTIGNLTLLTGPLNTAVRNLPFEKKVDEIDGYSLLALNAYFRKRVDEGKPWDEEAIAERGRNLFDAARAIWPHPA
ncbi:MAG: DUF262 domain-containing protein, partial [Chloroflexota bacterium]